MTPVLGNIMALLSVDFGDSTSPAGAKTWSSIASTSNEQTVTVPGLRLATDKVMGITKPTQQNGLVVGTARISADDTLAITFLTSGATVTPTAGEKYSVLVCRLEQTQAHAAA